MKGQKCFINFEEERIVKSGSEYGESATGSVFDDNPSPCYTDFIFVSRLNELKKVRILIETGNDLHSELPYAFSGS